MKERIILQNSAGIFLRRNGYYLLMKRSPKKKIAPGVWSCVGGHFEADELNDPLAACLRETREETGIPADRVFNPELRYIIIRRKENIIRQIYIYFGETDISEVKNNDEGTLHWIPEAELLNREFSKTFEAMLWHYKNTPVVDRLVVGVAENADGTLRMNWSVAEDFEL